MNNPPVAFDWNEAMNSFDFHAIDREVPNIQTKQTPTASTSSSASGPRFPRRWKVIMTSRRPSRSATTYIIQAKRTWSKVGFLASRFRFGFWFLQSQSSFLRNRLSTAGDWWKATITGAVRWGNWKAFSGRCSRLHHGNEATVGGKGRGNGQTACENGVEESFRLFARCHEPIIIIIYFVQLRSLPVILENLNQVCPDTTWSWSRLASTVVLMVLQHHLSPKMVLCYHGNLVCCP